MKKILIILGVIFVLLFVTVGCKSDPEPVPEETPVEEVPPVEPAPEPEVEPTPVPQEPVISEEELLANATKSAENAKSMKEKIENLSLQGYNELSYAAGLVALEGYDKLVEENAGAAEKLATATLAEKKFSEVLNSAFSKLSSEKKAEVKAIREKALEIKSDKADKVGYEAAQLLYTTADEYTELKDYENSYNYYVKALEAFDDVYNNVSAKRQAALEAIERAKNKANNVDEFAAEADKIAPLSTESDVQGEE
jgi:tetratricopeptide (TPR) repeat protein